MCSIMVGPNDLTFDFAIGTLNFKILSGLYLRNSKVQEVDT